jgi:hypothetical protein
MAKRIKSRRKQCKRKLIKGRTLINSRNLKTRRRRNKHFYKVKGGDLDEQAKQVVEQNLANRDVNRSKWLQVACKNPDNCLALGTYGDSIKQYFDNFQNFAYLDQSKLKRIGSPSANGFIIEMPFTKNGYTAYTALKCSAKATADNLMYEYIVGKRFINKQLKKFPLFLETYDLYEYVDDTSYENVKTAVSNNTLNTMDIPSSIQKVNVDDIDIKNIQPYKLWQIIGDACSKNKRLCMSIQHFDNFTPVGDHVENNQMWGDFKGDFLPLLFQIYFVLNELRDVYTHYDLHLDNVMMYKPFEGKKCILMRYHMTYDNKVMEFKSEYIPKIIDYGRNYFDDGTITSNLVITGSCSAQQCRPKCGENVGFEVISNTMVTGKPYLYYWIDPSKRNMSHDLRFANSLNDILPVFTNPKTKISSIIYDDEFGTRELLTYKKGEIHNVADMISVLKSNPTVMANVLNNVKYDSTWETVATMDVYDDGRDYEFVVLPAN